MKNPIIMLENITKKYDEYGVVVKALNQVSLKIHPGEFVSIIGPSGCGKSTLLHCMGLLDRPTTGNVYLEGKNTSEISGKEVAMFRGSKLGFVFQNYNLIPRLSVLENVILPGLIMQKDPVFLEKRAKALLKEVGIHHRANHKGVHLSGGEQQRVAIARSLINDPILILADEPTGALDTDSSEEIMELLVKVNKNRNVTSVFVSHDMYIASYGKRTLVLKDGSIVGDTKGKSNNFKKVLKKLPKKRGVFILGVSSHLAFGELKDHKRIYAIIILVIALTMTSFMLENAYLNYMMQVVDDTTKLVTADVIIVDESSNIRDLYGTESELKNAGEIARRIERDLPGYKTSIRVTAQGTYGLGEEGEVIDGCGIQGIDPIKDGYISGIAGKIVQGRFFRDDDPILRGHTPLYIEIKGPGVLPDFSYGTGEKLREYEEPYPIIVGSTAAKIHPSIDIGKDFQITLSVSGKEKSYATVTVEVIGLYESGTPTLDALVWFMHADSLREIKRYGQITGKDWHIPGVGTFRGYNPIDIDHDRGDAVLIRAPDPLHKLDPIGHSEGVKKEVSVFVPFLKVYSWHDFLIYIAGSMQDVVTIMLWGSIGVTLLLCGAAIKYVMDSIIMRKTREIGSLKAFGARDRVIFKIYLFQGLIIGFIAGILGILISLIVMQLVNFYGISVEFIAGTQLKVDFIINWLTILIAIALPVILAVIAAALPAKKASMLSPVEALRKGELAL